MIKVCRHPVDGMKKGVWKRVKRFQCFAFLRFFRRVAHKNIYCTKSRASEHQRKQISNTDRVRLTTLFDDVQRLWGGKKVQINIFCALIFRVKALLSF